MATENVINVTKDDWEAKNQTFCFEISEKRGAKITNELFLKSPSGNKVKFVLTSVDKDGSGEDTYGWRYVSTDGQFKLLIIND